MKTRTVNIQVVMQDSEDGLCPEIQSVTVDGTKVKRENDRFSSTELYYILSTKSWGLNLVIGSF